MAENPYTSPEDDNKPLAQASGGWQLLSRDFKVFLVVLVAFLAFCTLPTLLLDMLRR